MQNKITPTPQEISCLPTKLGAMELTIRMLIQKRTNKLIKVGNHKDFDIEQV